MGGHLVRSIEVFRTFCTMPTIYPVLWLILRVKFIAIRCEARDTPADPQPWCSSCYDISLREPSAQTYKAPDA
jgi:hypothetical protein